ncbi:hypothetical protein BgiBS90_029364 [Biomphalaria glabrata]|nr:hypothetical protein BgiBS90_029364 [Biomphalaria glabrata]
MAAETLRVVVGVNFVATNNIVVDFAVLAKTGDIAAAVVLDALEVIIVAFAGIDIAVLVVINDNVVDRVGVDKFVAAHFAGFVDFAALVELSGIACFVVLDSVVVVFVRMVSSELACTDFDVMDVLVVLAGIVVNVAVLSVAHIVGLYYVVEISVSDAVIHLGSKLFGVFNMSIVASVQ